MINIAKLLKDAPEGMKLYSPLCGEVEFAEVMNTSFMPIRVMKRGYGIRFDEYGRYNVNYPDAECLLFPSKDCRTWKGWELPVKPNFKVGDWITDGTCKVKITAISNTYYWYAKNCILGEIESIDKEYHLWSVEDAEDGDVLVTEDYIFIFKYVLHGGVHLYCHYNIDDKEFELAIQDAIIGNIHDKGIHFQPATQKQRNLFFKKMHEAGYQWYAGKKELRKIIEPQFKVGDSIVNDYCFGKVIEITNDAYLLDTGQGIPLSCEHNAHLWTIQDARNGDVLVVNGNSKEYKWIGIFKAHTSDTSFSSHCHYNCGMCEFVTHIARCTKHDTKYNDIRPATNEERDILFAKMWEAGYQWDADKKELKKISKHYDISSFHAGMPVLVRANNDCRWDYSAFSRTTGNENWPFAVCNGVSFTQCIPFNEDTKRLLGTTDMCPEEYINW